jgi:hypothetical protein
MPINPVWINDITPDEAKAVLEKLAEPFSEGMSPREAFELHKVQRALQAKVEGHRGHVAKYAGRVR